MKNKNTNLISLINHDCCFDLQFRKDTRHKRTGSPTYYRWKAQFIITKPKEQITILKKIKKSMGCGAIAIIKNQARFSVKNIGQITDMVIPFFTKHSLTNNKKKDFNLWQKAAHIIYKNKGIYLSKWKKNDILSPLQIHQATVKYKQKPRKQKWIEMAKTLTK